METSQDFILKLPEIGQNPKRKKRSAVLHLEKTEIEHRLEDYVRLHYLKYVEGILRDNYNFWLKSDTGQTSGLQVTQDEIRKTAEMIELEALKACMVVSLYRKEIIKMIDIIKSETQQNLLNSILMKTKFNGRPERKCVSTQTESTIAQKRIPSPIKIGHTDIKKAKSSFRSRNSNLDVSVATLDEKIRRFQESFINTGDEIEPPKIDKVNQIESKNNFYSIPGIIETPTRPPMTPTINLNDLLSQQKYKKQEFFAPATPNSTISQTASINLAQVPATPTCLLTPASTCTSNSHVRESHDEIEQKIMQELNEMFGEDDAEMTTATTDDARKLEMTLDDTNREPSPVIDLQVLSEMKDPEEREKELREQLMSSIWPCELHHQKMRLRTVLSDIAERNFRKYEKIKRRFRELFDDDDSENELAPYSPSIELDEILLSSCRKRISNWVVKSLMKPYKNGQIEKFLFKRLAKLLAESIIYQDQYPNEKFVKDYIYDFLCQHPRIACLEDMYTDNYLN